MHLTIKNSRLKFLVALPVAGVLLGILLLGWRLWSDREQVDTPYRYQFTRSSPGSISAGLEREIAFYQERIQRSPEDGLDRAALAKTYLKMARATGNAQWYLLAEQSAKRSLANLPFSNQGAIIVLARVAEASHDFPTAIRFAEQVLKEQPRQEDAMSILITSYLAMGKLDQAATVAKTLTTQIPSLGTLTLRALVQVARGEDEAAIASFQQALAKEEAGETGSSAWARTMMGRFYFKRGNPMLAKQLYQEALRILPRYPLALMHLAELETRQGNYAEADRLYSEIYISPAYPNIYDHVAWQARAQVKEIQGDREGAKELWDKAEGLLKMHLNVSAFGHRRELARLLLARGRGEDLPEARSLMVAEVEIRRDAETLDTFAWVLSRLEEWTQARQAIQEALALGTRDAGIFYRAGKIEQALGNQTQAQIYFQQAKATDPSFNEQARQTLGIDLGISDRN